MNLYIYCILLAVGPAAVLAKRQFLVVGPALPRETVRQCGGQGTETRESSSSVPPLHYRSTQSTSILHTSAQRGHLSDSCLSHPLPNYTTILMKYELHVHCLYRMI